MFRMPTEEQMAENDRRHWYHLGPAGMCPRCGEERLTTRVDDARGTRMYCAVCSHEWGTKR